MNDPTPTPAQEQAVAPTPTATPVVIIKKEPTGFATSGLVLGIVAFLSTLPFHALAISASAPANNAAETYGAVALGMAGFALYCTFVLPIFVILALIFGIIAIVKSNKNARIMGIVACSLAVAAVLSVIVVGVEFTSGY